MGWDHLYLVNRPVSSSHIQLRDYLGLERAFVQYVVTRPEGSKCIQLPDQIGLDWTICILVSSNCILTLDCIGLDMSVCILLLDQLSATIS